MDDVAAKFKKEASIIASWENGEGKPTFAQLERLAYEIYKRPLAVFFLPTPPEEHSPSEDFRTLPEVDVSAMSPKLRLSIRRAKSHQLALKELFPSGNPSEKAIHKSLKIKAEKFEQVAQALRETLGLTLDLQRSFKDSRLAFNHYRDTIEKLGIFVFQDTLDGARGFSLMDNEFPVIVVNSSDSHNGRNFTLFHELSHVLLNEGGIFKDAFIGHLTNTANKVEVFCNRLAAETLLPSNVLLSEPAIKSHDPDNAWTSAELQPLAARYSLSKEVILRKLLDANLATQRNYLSLKREWDDEFKRQKKKQKESTGGPTFYRTKASQLGTNFIASALGSFYENKISTKQVTSMLSVKVNQIPKLEAELFG